MARATTKKASPAADAAAPERRAELAGWQGRVVARSLEQATQRSIERGRSLIDAAIQLLRREGSVGFTVQEVADLAGQSLRTFYQHFGSKNDLLLAVFEEEVRQHAEGLRAAVMKYDDPVERIAAFMVAGTSTRVLEIRDSKALTQYRIELAVSRPDDLAAVQAPVVQLAREVVAHAVDSGAISARDPESTAYTLVTLKTAVLHSKILGNELGVRLPDPVELARFCIEGMNAEFPKGFEKRLPAPPNA